MVGSLESWSGVPGSAPEPPGALRSRQELSGDVRSFQEPPGAARSRQELSGAGRSSPEPPEALRSRSSGWPPPLPAAGPELKWLRCQINFHIKSEQFQLRLASPPSGGWAGAQMA